MIYCVTRGICWKVHTVIFVHEKGIEEMIELKVKKQIWRF